MTIYISHLIEDFHILEVLDRYSVGIEPIHFSISSILDELDQEMFLYQKQMKGMLQQVPISLHAPFFDLSPASYDSLIRKVTMDRFDTIYRIAEEMNADRIIFHTGFIPTVFYIEGWLGNSIAFWQEFMKDKDERIQIHLENVFETEFWPMAEVIDEVAHPAFTACLDLGHVHAYSGKSVDEWLKGLGSRIGHFHIHNNDGKTDGHLGLLDGAMDMSLILPLIRRQYPQANWTLEITDARQLIASLDWLQQLPHMDIGKRVSP